MSWAITGQVFIWRMGWFGGSSGRRFKLLKCEIAVLGLGVNIELSIL